MSSYRTFTTTRTTQVDLRQIVGDYRAQTADQTMVLGFAVPTDYHLVAGKKATVWTPGQITAVQNAIDTGAAVTPRSLAQAEIDTAPIALWALALMLLDEINVLRTELNTVRAAVSPPLTPPLAPRNEQQAKNAWRTKAGTL